MPAPSLTSLQEQVDQINDGLNHRGFDLGLPLHGFADVQTATSSRQDPLRLRGFNAGTLDLYLTPQLGDRVRSLVEIAFEYDPGGKGSQADMERLQLGYSINDELTLWMGRFHTPFGLWNTYFHHGANLQTSIYRPQFLDFEDRGGIIPAHSVGIWASGKTPAGPGKLTYDAYLSNGPSVRDRSLDFNPFTDDTANKMVGFNLGYQPSGGLHGWTAGVHGFASNVTSFTPADVAINVARLRMAGAYAGYDNDDWEAFAEFYGFFDRNNSDNSQHRSNVGFVHVGRTFGSLTPYVRYERASIDAAWENNHEHPSLMKSLFAISHMLFHDKLELFADDSTAFRFPGMVSMGVAIYQGGWAIHQLWFFWVMPLIGAGLAGIVQRWLAQK